MLSPKAPGQPFSACFVLKGTRSMMCNASSSSAAWTWDLVLCGYVACGMSFAFLGSSGTRFGKKDGSSMRAFRGLACLIRGHTLEL